MTRTERDLVTALRAELAAIDPSRPCDRAAEAIGLGANGIDGLAPAVRDGAVARLAVRLRRGSDDRRPRVRLGDRRGALPDGLAARPVPGARLAQPRRRADAPRVRRRRRRRRRSSPPGSPTSGCRRRGGSAAAAVSSPGRAARRSGTFLRRIGAGGALLELEARQVSRALRGELNRVLNAESANLQRAVSAAGRQLDAIAALDADGRLAEQPDVVRLVAAARRETPEATLTELAERLGLHRSAVQRALERVERLALHDDDATSRTTRRRRRRPPEVAALA